MSETCADCGKPINYGEPSYYSKDPAGGDFGKTYHSHCGDPFGIKAKDAEIARLRVALKGLVDRLDYVHNDPAYASVWALNQLHNGPYRGPTYTADLEKARATLRE